MTAILSLLTRISIILGVIGAFFLSLSDIIMKTDYLNQIDNYLDFSSLKAQIIVLLIATLYLVLFFSKARDTSTIVPILSDNVKTCSIVIPLLFIY